MKYKPVLISAVTIFVVVLVGVWLSEQLPAATTTPTIGTPTATPGVVVVNTPTSVTFTIDLSGTPSAIPNGVNLLRLSSTGVQTIVATMNDNGKSGDVKAGDKIFTAVLNMNEAQPAAFTFQVSAAFPGQLKRVLSPLLQFAALAPTTVPVVLPPDPGPAGTATLAGIDSDGDGVRDDVERYIVFTYPQSAKIRAALTQLAKAWQAEYLNVTTKSDAVAAITTWEHAQECLDSIILTSDADVSGVLTSNNMDDMMKEQVLNTPARVQAFFQADSLLSPFLYTGRPPFAGLSARCTFSPSRFPN